MDASDAGGACARRWYVFAPILALAVIAGYGFSGGRPSDYTCDGGLAVIPPMSAAATGGPTTGAIDPAQGNPLTPAGGSALFEQVLATELSSKVSQSELAPPHSDITFTVAAAPDSEILTVAGTGDNEGQVLSTVKRVMAIVPVRLAAIQQAARTPAASMYHAAVVNSPSITVITPPSKFKLIGSFGIVGLLVGAALAVLVDRKAGRRTALPATAPVPGDITAPVPGDTNAPVPGDTNAPVPGDADSARPTPPE